MAHQFSRISSQNVRGGGSTGPSHPEGPLADPDVFQDYTTYDPTLPVPCDNRDLESSPEVDRRRLARELPPQEENDGQGTQPTTQAWASLYSQDGPPPAFVPPTPGAGPSSAPGVGMAPNGWGVGPMASAPATVMSGTRVLYRLQDPARYDPRIQLPCNNYDLKESPPLVRERPAELTWFEDTPGASTSAVPMNHPWGSLLQTDEVIEGGAQGRATTEGGSRAANKRKQATSGAQAEMDGEGRKRRRFE